MTAKQVQIRRDSNTNLMAVPPAAGELAYNTSTERIHVGNGSDNGGIILPNAADTQKNSFTYAITAGSGNAYTLTLSPAIDSYQAGQSFRIIADRANTGSATLNVSGAGALSIVKKSGGSLVNLDSGDLIEDAAYELFHNGTSLEVMNSLDAGGGLLSVSQGDLNTSTGTFSDTINSGQTVDYNFYVGSTEITLPGGEYGFFIRSEDATNNQPGGTSGRITFWAITNVGATIAQKIRAVQLIGSGTTQGENFKGSQRYITSSPPFDMGDGEVGGFIFALVDRAGEIVAHYAADVPPWAYNGPTNIRACKKCPVTGKKFRRVMTERSLEEIMDGAKINYEFQEITQAIKSADMGLIPHPFGVVPEGHSVVLLNPMDQRLADLIEYQNAGGDREIMQALLSGKIRADNTPLNRAGPPGVMQVNLKFKYSRK